MATPSRDTAMPTPYASALALASTVLAMACTQPPKAEPGDEVVEAEVEPAKTEPEPAKADAPKTQPEPAKAEPEAPEPATARTAASTSTLRVAAVREGGVALLRQRDAPLLVIDGEPVRLVDGTFARHPVGSAGLWPDAPVDTEETMVIAAVDLDEPLGAWVSVEHVAMRSASRHAVYRRDGQAWQRVRLRQDGVLVEHYAAFVERDGALLALRSWVAEPDQANELGQDGSPRGDAYMAKMNRALARAKQAWVPVAGPVPAALPEIPEGLSVTSRVTTNADGTIVAVGQEQRSDGSDVPYVLLAWRPGETTPERVEVPALADSHEPELHGSGDWALVTGSVVAEPSESYLATGHGGTWERVASLPARSAAVPIHVIGGARLPDGELWIAFGDPVTDGGDAEPIWRRPMDGPWQAVPLPSVAADVFGPADGWVRDVTDESRSWVPGERPREAAVLDRGIDLLSAGGAVWIVVQGEAAYGNVGESPDRTVVLTTSPGAAPPVVLPPEWALALERRNHGVRAAKPGAKQCEGFTIVLGPPSLAEGSPALAGTLAGLALEGADARIRSVHVARRAGAEVLVAEAEATSPADAAALREAVVAAMTAAGVPTDAVASECRIPAIERMIAPLPTP